MKFFNFIFVRLSLIMLLVLSITGCDNNESHDEERIVIEGWDCLDNTCYLLETIGGYVTTYNIEKNTFEIQIINPTDQQIGVAEYDFDSGSLTIVYHGDSESYTCPFYSIDECKLSMEQQNYLEYSVAQINLFVNEKNNPQTN